MLYSDFILLQKPWSYCKFDTPLGSSRFLDCSGNSNHVFPFNNDCITTNTETGATLLSEHNSFFYNYQLKTGITNDNHLLSSSELGLHFNIPVFKQGLIFYRPRVQLDYPVVIDKMWFDIVLTNCNANFNYDFANDSFDSLIGISGKKTSVFNLDTENFDEDVIGILSSYSGENIVGSLQSGYSHKRFQLQFLLGPIQVYTVTSCLYDFEGNPYKQFLTLSFYHNQKDLAHFILKERKKVSGVFEITEFDAPKRLTMGIHQNENNLQFNISFDGNSVTTINIDSDIKINNTYKVIRIVSSFKIYSFSIFFNRDFPSSNWLEASFIALDSPTLQKCLELSSSRFTPDDYGIPKIENEINCYSHFFDAIMMQGANQTNVKSYQIGTSHHLQYTLLVSEFSPALNIGEIEVNDIVKINQNANDLFFGTWKVIDVTSETITIQPSLTCAFNLNITSDSEILHSVSSATASCNNIVINLENDHLFKKNDLVVIFTYYLASKNLNWKVISVDSTTIVVEFDESTTTRTYPNKELIIKKAPIGGYNSWTKEWHDFHIHWYGRNHGVTQHLRISDFYKKYAIVRKSSHDLSHLSEQGYFTKNIKSIHLKDKRCIFNLIGNAYCFYLFVNSKENTLSNSQLFMFGELDTFPPTSSYNYYLIAYNDHQLDYNYRNNNAFRFPDWLIISTGHLLCRNNESGASSDGQSNYNSLVKYKIIENGGFCLYPDTFNPSDLICISVFDGQNSQLTLS